MKDPSDMSGMELRTESKRADRALGAELDRIRIQDERFRQALDRSIALQDELDRRKNR